MDHQHDSSGNSNGDDPFEEDPELEYAPTMAMEAIPSPGGSGAPAAVEAEPPGPAEGVPLAHQAPLSQPPLQQGQPLPQAQPFPQGQPLPQGPSPQNHAPGQPNAPFRPGRQGPPPGARRTVSGSEKRFGISSVLAILGGALITIAFFLPMLGGGYIHDEFFDELTIFPPQVLYDEEIPVPEDMQELADLSRELLSTIGFDDFHQSFYDADTQEEQEKRLSEYGISPYQMMRMSQVVDFNAKGFEAPRDAQAAFRWFWLALLWMALAGVVPILMAIIRIFRPLNGFQVAWSGTFGMLWFGAALAMMLVEESKLVGETRLFLFQGTGVSLLLVGSALLWLSAFAGLSRTNWWKSPLFGLLILFLYGVTTVAPAVLLAA